MSPHASSDDVELPGLLVMAAGMAMFAAPLSAATLGAAREADQGVASGVNNVMGQLAGLLAIAILPAAAGLGQATITGPEFADGLATALLIVTALAVAACAIVALTFRSGGTRPARVIEPASAGGERTT